MAKRCTLMSLAVLRSVVTVGALLVLAQTASAQGGAAPPGESDFAGYGTGTNRDKTRVFGTVYDSSGTPLAQADVRVKNDQAPADEVRARSRKTGTYLARSLGSIYTERDLEGIRIRVRYERDGYQPVEIVSGVAKNDGVEINPILWRIGEDSATMTKWAVIVTGNVVNAKGKKVKGATYTLTSPVDDSLKVEGKAEKDGTFRTLLWGGPNTFLLTVQGGGATKEIPFRIDGNPRTDVVTELRHEVRLDIK